MQTVRRDAHTKQSVSKIKTKAMLQVRRIAFVFIAFSSRIKSNTSTLLHKAVTALAITGLFVPGSVLVLGLNNRAIAAESTYINFQARILQSSGALVPDGTYHVEFKLYSASTGGTALWTETRSPSTADPDKAIVKNGYVSVRLGAVNAFTNAVSQINWDQELYLTMNVGGTGGVASWDGEMSPRLMLTSVPYSKVSKTSLGVNSNATNSTSTNSSNVSISTGNATGLTSNSGNITIDSGTATGTAGTISIANTNASGLTLGRSGITITANGNLNIANSSNLQVGGTTVITAARVLQNVTADTSILTSGTLSVARGGTGAATFTTNGVLFGNGTNAIQATAAGTAGQVLIANASGVPTFTSLSGDVTVNGTGVMTISADSVVLGTDTTGNYVGNVSAGTGLAVTGVAAENWTATVALDYTATLAGNPALTANLSSFASTGLIFEGSTADTNELLLTVTDPTADRTITLPNESGTICTTGSVCSGYAPSSGGNYLAKNSTDTSTAAVGAASYLYTLTNSGSAATGGVLSLSNGTNTGNILNVVGTGNGTYIFANNTNASPSGNLIDLQSSSTSRFNVTAAGATTIAGALTVNNTAYVRNLTTGTATATDDQLILSVTAGGAARFNGTITSADLTAARTYTLPDASGTICISGATCTGLGYLTAEADTLATVTGRGATTSTASSFTGGATIRGLTVDTATATDDRILLSVTTGGAGRFDGTITSADLTSAQTYTLPNATGTFITTGNLSSITSTGTITSGTWQGTAVAVGYGGTGATTLTANGVLFGNGTNAVGATAAGTTGQCLVATTGAAPSWGTCGTAGAVASIGTIDSQTKSANGAVIASGVLYLQTADASSVGLVSTGTQSFAGAKTFTGAVVVNGNLTAASGNLFVGVDSTTNGTITLYSSGAVTDPTLAANAAGDLNIQSTAGTVVVGDGTGGIDLQLTNASDVLLGSKTFTAGAAYSNTDFSFVRTATGSTFNLTGNVLKVEDNSTVTSGSNTPTVLYVNQVNTAAGGFLINAAQNGVSKFSVTPAGNASLAGALTLGTASTTAGTIVMNNSSNAFTTTLQSSTASSNKTITLPNETGTVCTTASVCSGYQATISIGTIDSQTKSANGAVISSNSLVMQTADATNPGLVSTSTQTFAGAKTIQASSASAFVVQATSGTDKVLEAITNTTNGSLRVYDKSNNVNYASISYSGSTAVFAASSGTTQIGGGTSGNIQLTLNSNADQMLATKATTPAAAYSLSDYNFTRNLTGTTFALTGSVLKVEDTSTFTSGSSSPNVLLINQNNTSATGNLILAQTGGSTTRFAVTTAGNTTVGGTLAVTGNTTLSANLTVGSGAGVGLFTNNGATVNTTLAITDKATGGAIGTAAATVDIYTSATINQTTASQTITVPSPTTTTAGRMFYLTNIGTASVTFSNTNLNSTLSPNSTASLMWSGTAWVFAGADGNGILNQNTATQTANFNINGTGTAATFNATTGINTGASAGTQRIDASGNLLNIGTITSSSSATTGSILQVTASSLAPAAAATGNGSSITVGQAASNTTGNSVVNAYSSSMSLNATGAGGTKDLTAFNANAATLTACTGGNCTVNGLRVATQSTGALATITQNGVNVQAVGVALGSLNGVNISAITGGAGTETAINIGSGWDNVLSVNGVTVINGSGVTQVTGGGTGASTLTSNGVLFGNGTSAVGATAAGTTGQCLVATTGAAPSWGTCGAAGTFLNKNSADTSSAAVTASGYLYGFTNSSSAVASGVLSLNNGNNTGTALFVTATAGTLMDLQNGGASRFSVTAAGAATVSNGLTVTAGGATVTAGNLAVTAGDITTAGTIRLTNAGALSNITGYTQTSGNFAMSGTGTFGTGTGAVSLNGATSVTGTNTFSVGTGTSTFAATSDALILSGTPSASATASVIRLGATIASGSASGTYIGSNPASFAGDFINMQVGGAVRLRVTNTGATTVGNTLTVTTGGIAATGNSTIAGTLTSLTGLTSSGTITFSGLATAGVVTNTAAGVLGTATSLTGLTGISSSGTITLSGLTASRAVFTDVSNNLSSTGASAALLNSLSDETGTGVAVFGTSPTITTSLVAGSASFDLLNTTATTINFGAAATTLNIGAATGSTINLGAAAGTSGGTQTIKTINQSAASTSSAGLTFTTGNAAGATSNSGSISIDSGTATGTTGSIAIGANNASSLALGRTGSATTVNGSSITANGATNFTNSVAFKKGTDIATAGGTTTDLSISDASLIRFTGTLTQTINGIAGGRDGRLLTIVNASTQSINFGNNTGTAGNQLTSGMSSTLSLESGASMTIVYDSTGVAATSFWRVTGGGVATTLQEAYIYNSTGTTIPEITLDSTRTGFTIRNATSDSITGNLFELQNNAGTLTYFGITPTGLLMKDASNQNTLEVVSTDSTHELRVYDASGSNYANIYATTTGAVFMANSGTTQIGTGSGAGGDINLLLTTTTDNLNVSKTFSAAAGYTDNDFNFTRTITGTSYALTGSVMKIEDQSSFTLGSSAPNVLLVNQNNTSATGNLLLLQTGGITTRFAVDTSGNTTVGGTLTVTGSTTLNGSLNVVGSVSYTNLTVGASAGIGLFTNNGATVNTTLALSNFATNSSIGTAAATVDIYTSFSINQTTAGVALTIPTPTASTTFGRTIYLSNIGTADFTVNGTTVENGSTATFIWSNTTGGNTWQLAGFGYTSTALALSTSVNITPATLTSGSALNVTAQNANTTNTAVQGIKFNYTNAQATLANTAGIVGVGLNYTQNPTIAGNTEYAFRIQNQVTANTTDTAVSALLYLDNADTTASGSTAITSAILIQNTGNIAAGIATAININDADITTDLALQNGETIDNNTDGTIQVVATNVDLVSSTTGLRVTATGISDIDGGLTISTAANGNIALTPNGTGNVTVGTSNTTGTLLVLDTKTDATDPSPATDGAMYYNSSLSRFRCYGGGVWTDCMNTWITIRKTADQDVTASSTLANDTVLQFPVTANTLYSVKFNICYAGNTIAGDYKAAFVFPTTTNAYNVVGRYINTTTADGFQQLHGGALGAATAFPAAAGVSMGTAAVTTDKRLFEGSFSFQPDSNGTMNYQFAQNTLTASTVARTCAGSFIEYAAM